MKFEAPKPDDVAAQLERLHGWARFRGKKLQKLLDFLVGEWLANGGVKLTLSYIAESLKDEELTFEEDSSKWGYPKTRANLAHVRNRLKIYFETDGYRDPLIIKLNAGSYAPVISANPMAASVPDLDPALARLILRAKTAIDTRTLKGALRAMRYYGQLPQTFDDDRLSANLVFLPMAAASVIPSAVAAVRPLFDVIVATVKRAEVAPWEAIFSEACGAACYTHEWHEALRLFQLSVTASQGEAGFYWWYTALLASLGKSEQAITLLDDAVRHFSRTNIAVRADLALLQIMTGRFEEAEEHLSASLDFTSPDHPLIASHFALLYEAQDRLDDGVVALSRRLQFELSAAGEGGGEENRDGCIFLLGLMALIMGRAGATSAAAEMLNILLSNKAQRPATSSVDVALACIGAGRLDDAVSWLEKAAFEEYDPIAMWFHILPPLRHLRRTKSYRALLRRLKLPLPQSR